MKQAGRFLSKYIKRNFGVFAIYMLLCILCSILSLIAPYISGNFIDVLLHIEQREQLVKYCVVFATMSFGSIACNYIISQIFARLRIKMNYEINMDFLHHSGTREVCSHIVCKITGNILNNCIHQKVRDIISTSQEILPSGVYDIIRSYLQIDHANLNSRISLLYAAYLVITDTKRINANSITNMVSCVFDRLFSETRLNLPVDYRELWLLENSLCILIDFYIDSCTESRI